VNKKTIVLITGNPLNHEGGMVAFNKGLITTLNSFKKDYKLKHFSIGSRMSLFYFPILKRLIYPFLLFFDLTRLFFTLFNKNIKIIQHNPSLIPVPLVRDGLAQLINNIVFKKKSVIVLHGWKEHIFKKIIDNKLYRFLIIKFFNSADVVFVLSEEFKSKLIELGVNKLKINVTTTFFYKHDIKTLPNQTAKTDVVKFVYLGRVSKIKGMDELISAFNIVKNRTYNFTCNIIGHGDKPKTLEYYKDLVIENNLDDKIIFLGRKTGEEKFKLLSNADIYVFPSYMEGCPTSVIEALASGLFVISTDVGALNDIINEDNGVTVKPKQIDTLANAILLSMENIEIIRSKQREIADNAILKFEVNQIAKQFHISYQNLIDY
jgi:glycosyltransferase involved in cell wall biosynthesis